MNIICGFYFEDESQNFSTAVPAEWLESKEIFISKLIFSFGDLDSLKDIEITVEKPDWLKDIEILENLETSGNDNTIIEWWKTVL